MRSAGRRLSKYIFGSYNPYLPAEGEIALVSENLHRLKSDKISLRDFLKQTPHFARWEDKHIRRARILLVTNEPGLNGIEELYSDMNSANSVTAVARRFHNSMLSWLGLSNHPLLGAINGEHLWMESGAWETKHLALSTCGKVGYFMAPGEEIELETCKVLHVELSPFSQDNVSDVNPRNDQDIEYHHENLRTVAKFCSFASESEPRYIFIVGNRARIRQLGNDHYRLEGIKTIRKDKSCKILDLLQVVDPKRDHVQVRLCRRWPTQGRDVNVLTVASSAAYHLRRLNGE